LTSPVTIAVDCMGGDHGVTPMVEGALAALHEDPDTSLAIVLVGDRPQIQAVLDRQNQVPADVLSKRVRIEHADDEVTMDDRAADAVRRNDTSIAVGLRMHHEGKVDGFISPGNTGAVMASSLRHLSRLPGVIRPAIASLFPNQKTVTLVLDVGANAECKPQHLHQFAVMGSLFYQHVLKRDRPRVGLLSIGEEPSKGPESIQAAHKLLAAEPHIHFVGNIEGRDVLNGQVDVVVTDGYVGNILLKFAESVMPLLEAKLRHQINANVFSKIGVFLLRPFLRRTRNSLDYAEYGGAPLLGVDGVVVICHGSSSAKAIKNAIFEAERSFRMNVNTHIKDQLEKVQASEATNVA
jgi:glycerol-3-phosphate acyltransferase PlsX